ncbi:hypothetical protein [Thermococcus sp. CX2]|uniref:hypothetical protein n=1 Tax=Thermococcus sp. CX2 TaxID=163006 RepID=UPI001F0D4C6E|nr:hypothetical protein [Thermococcus sp. CX2]
MLIWWEDMRKSVALLAVSALAIVGFFALAPAFSLYPVLADRYGAETIDAVTVILGIVGLFSLMAGIALWKMEILPRKVAIYEIIEFLTMWFGGMVWINVVTSLNGFTEKALVTVAFFLVLVVFLEMLRRKLDPGRYRRIWVAFWGVRDREEKF